MIDKLDDAAPFNDDQGTRTSDDSTGAGAEASRATDGEPGSGSHKHESGYGGRGGQPKLPNEGAPERSTDKS